MGPNIVLSVVSDVLTILTVHIGIKIYLSGYIILADGLVSYVNNTIIWCAAELIHIVPTITTKPVKSDTKLENVATNDTSPLEDGIVRVEVKRRLESFKTPTCLQRQYYTYLELKGLSSADHKYSLTHIFQCQISGANAKDHHSRIRLYSEDFH